MVPSEEELPLDPDDPLLNVISEERLNLLTGDRLTVFANLGEGGDGEIEGLEGVPTYVQLPAAEANEVLRLDVQLPFLTAGLDGRREALDGSR